jgi:hypothetical protein
MNAWSEDPFLDISSFAARVPPWPVPIWEYRPVRSPGEPLLQQRRRQEPSAVRAQIGAVKAKQHWVFRVNLIAVGEERRR